MDFAFERCREEVDLERRLVEKLAWMCEQGTFLPINRILRFSSCCRGLMDFGSLTVMSV